MEKTKYMCPTCKGSSIISTQCITCSRMMIEVCVSCEKPPSDCICGKDIEPSESSFDEDEKVMKNVKVRYICPKCSSDSSPIPAKCIYCDKDMEKVEICAECGELIKNCECGEYEAIGKVSN